MRFVLTVPSLGVPMAEPARAVHGIADHLALHGHAVQVLTYTAPAPGEPEVEYQVVGPTKEGPPVGPVLRRLLEDFGPDAVLAVDPRNDLTRETVKWALGKGVRTGLLPMGGFGAWKKLAGGWDRVRAQAYDRFLGQGLRDPRVTILATCLQEEREVAEALPGRKPLRLYLGSHLTAHPRLRAVRNPPRALMLAQFDTVRDPRWAVVAAQRARDAGAPVNLSLAGPPASPGPYAGPVPPEAFQGADHLGPAPPRLHREVLEGADLLVYPSRYDAFGFPVLEAAMLGLPVVTTPVGIASELGFEEGTGALASGPEPQYLTPALMDLLRRLEDAQGTAGLSAPALRAWADWGVRGEAFRAWFEGGEATTEPPPKPVRWEGYLAEGARSPLGL